MWPQFLLDLTMWHAWHKERGTLPAPWKGMSLSDICRQLGIRTWRTERPWRAALEGIDVREVKTDSEKTVTWETGAGPLVSAWTLGPDGDWWQSRYPVQSRADLDAAMAVAEALRYIVQASEDADTGAPDDLTAAELPQMPLSEIFHAFLGWSDGLMLFLEEPGVVREIVGCLERKHAALVEELAARHFSLALSPDNLDAQFMTQSLFEEDLAPGYSRAARMLHDHGKHLVVHVGGPVARLLPGLAHSGVDCVQGICGAPQGDTTLADARSLCGPATFLWGGIAQDCLLSTHPESGLQTAARACFELAAADDRVIVGVADKVPVSARPERIQALAAMAGMRG
jgi:hypothetical protein